MKYIEIKTGPWPNTHLPWWATLLKKIIPAANPDFELLYPDMRTWWVELNEKGVPTREIGFDENGTPTVLAPFARNYGFIVDTSSPWAEDDTECQEAKEEFQSVWDGLETQLSNLKE